MLACQNIYGVLEQTVQRCNAQPAYYEKQTNQWQTISWESYKQQVDTFAMALLSDGFSKGDTFSILAANCLAWPIADMGCIAAGGIGIGLYLTSSAEQCIYILNHAKSKYLLLDSQSQLDKILSIKEQVPHLKSIIVRGQFTTTDKSVIAWQDFMQKGKDFASSSHHWEKYQIIAHASKYEDIVIVVYTSGTTGNPKGACLSNRYVISSMLALDHFVQTVLKSLPNAQQKVLTEQPLDTLSYLPFCHVAERISGMYTRLYRGDAAYLVSDFSSLNHTLQIAQPHGFGGVPRIFEKLYHSIMQQVENGEGFNKQSFISAIEINKQFKKLQNQSSPIPKSLQSAFNQAEQEVYSKVRAYFGERIVYCSSGAAPLPEKVLEMFEYAANMHILEAYGLTEFVCCAFNTPQAHRAKSVGKAMLGCQIKIAEDGEILLKGPQMFSGYYRDEQTTKEVIDSNGWLHSGDIGHLDEDGFVYITGRKKEFIKTSTGKKIAPLAIENLCKRNHLISNVMVYGDNKKYLTALITLNEVELIAYADRLQLKYGQYSDLIQHPQIQSMLTEVVEEVNRRVSRTEQIKKYTLLEHDFSIQHNEITPTGKIKRKQITQRYADVIQCMYDLDECSLINTAK